MNRFKARQGKDMVEFYSEKEFETWSENLHEQGDDLKWWNIKYYKGLGTSTSAEFRDYFVKMSDHTQQFKVTGDPCFKAIDDAFSADEVEIRRQFILNYDHSDQFDETPDEIKVNDFIHYQLGNYFMHSATRALPNIMDGLKDVQRKILWVCLNRQNKEIKVAQLAGAVAEKANYHHGETSIQNAIVHMARDIVGTSPQNNINLLEPIGQFGSRLEGGKDSAAARYIFTKLSPVTKSIYMSSDDQLYSYTTDDGTQREPDYYAPIIPMLLINGAYGIGVGFRTNIPAHCPVSVIESIQALIEGKEPEELTPWYRGFKGDIQMTEKNSFTSYGRFRKVKETNTVAHFNIDELPLGVWTQDYVKKLKKWKADELIKSFDDYSSDVKVNIDVRLANDKNVTDVLRLSKSNKYGNSMVGLDHYGRVKVYKSTQEILSDYFVVRAQLYEKRFSGLTAEKKAKSAFTINQLRFIEEKKKLNIESRTKNEVVNILRTAKFESNPVNQELMSDHNFKTREIS